MLEDIATLTGGVVISEELGYDLKEAFWGNGYMQEALKEIIAFAAKSMLDDIAMGFFIVFEDLFSVGDFIEVDGATGTVVEIGLRSVKIRVLTGETVIIPNGNINKVINHSISNGQAVVDISVAYEADLNKALSTLEEVATRTFDLYDEIIKRPVVLLSLIHISEPTRH